MDRPCGSRTSLYDTKQLDVVLEGMARQAAVLLAGRSLVAVIGILPVVIVYPFVQKHFIKGVVLGAVKG